MTRELLLETGYPNRVTRIAPMAPAAPNIAMRGDYPDGITAPIPILTAYDVLAVTQTDVRIVWEPMRPSL
jgi:hypothetical protein